MDVIGVFTSGGDAPGMNACLRAVVRTAIYRGCRVIGIQRGYVGMIEGEFEELTAKSVSNIVQLGGTMLKTGRSERFREREGREEAAEQLRRAGVEGLVAIGGDGTFRGAHDLWEEYGIPIVGVPGTIDNDLYGTDATIGYHTAVARGVEAIDRIRDTATSHERIFFVEVMGREAGFIALAVGAAGGAELIAVPERDMSVEDIYRTLEEGVERGKTSSIVVVAEGDEEGGALAIARKVQQMGPVECRVCVLGHTQRGGNPVPADRILASRLGAEAVDALLDGKSDVMVGLIDKRIVFTPFRETWEKRKNLDQDLYELARMLAT